MNYLYNGVELPDIDAVWTDKEAYPYAVIGMSPSGKCTLYISDSTGTYSKVNGCFFFEYGTYQNPYTLITYSCYEGGPNWEYEETISMCFSSYYIENIKPAFWSSYDTFDNEGGLYIAASDPAPIVCVRFDLKSWLTGFALGIAGKALPIPPREKALVAYLYNSVRLPPLPQWDIEKYPYAHIITRASENEVYLTVTSKPLVAGSQKNPADGSMIVCTQGSGVDYNEWVNMGGEWKHLIEEHTGARSYDSDYWVVIWADQDIENTDDGNIYLAASDPVPVYE